MVRSDISVPAVLGNVTGMFGTAGGEGALTSNEQDVPETPSRTHLRTLRFSTREGLSITVSNV